MPVSSQIQVAVSYSAIVGQVIQKLRDSNNLSQKEFAESLGIRQGSYSRIENGTTVLSLDQLHTIAQLLNKKPAEILQEADNSADKLLARGIQTTQRDNTNDCTALITGAALGALLATILLKR